MYGALAERTGGTFNAELQQVFASDTTGVAIYRGTGQREGKSLDQPYALVFEFVNGKAVRITDVPSDADAEDSFLA
jgi:ketosteroid isomerase-like protein